MKFMKNAMPHTTLGMRKALNSIWRIHTLPAQHKQSSVLHPVKPLIEGWVPPLSLIQIMFSQIFDHTAMLYCVDWWNRQWFQSKCSNDRILSHWIAWSHYLWLVTNECVPLLVKEILLESTCLLLCWYLLALHCETNMVATLQAFHMQHYLWYTIM